MKLSISLLSALLFSSQLVSGKEQLRKRNQLKSNGLGSTILGGDVTSGGAFALAGHQLTKRSSSGGDLGGSNGTPPNSADAQPIRPDNLTSDEAALRDLAVSTREGIKQWLDKTEIELVSARNYVRQNIDKLKELSLLDIGSLERDRLNSMIVEFTKTLTNLNQGFASIEAARSRGA